MAAHKGHIKAGGRTKDTPNKSTKITKELIESVLFSRKDDINDALDLLKKDPAKFIEAISKLLPYVLARKTDITSDEEKINIIFIHNEPED